MPIENVPYTSEELDERRETERRLKLIQLCEDLALAAESAVSAAVRTSYAHRYRHIVGVFPDRRAEFQHALSSRVNVPVAELVETFADA